MVDLQWDSPLQYIRGVGPRRAEAFASIGLRTIRDLLHFLPFRYEAELGELPIADLRPGVTATICGEILRIRQRPPGLTVQVIDGSGQACTLRWFEARFVQQKFQVGMRVRATGPVREYDRNLELVQPSISLLDADEDQRSGRPGPRLIPVYHAGAGLSSEAIRRVVEPVLSAPLPVEPEWIPAHLLRLHSLPPHELALHTLHRPDDQAGLAMARRRLAYEELLMLQLGMLQRRRRRKSRRVGYLLHVTPEIDRRIRARFPFSLTPAQDQVVAEIGHDLQSGRPMTRLLQGDVGSGKTVVALYASLSAIANRRQAAIMAPTELLAQQHYRNVQQYLAGSRVRCMLLTGALTGRGRAEALSRIQTGQVDLVIGTQALIQSDVAFDRLALVVVDEQHKFGVLQRALIRTKGAEPHYLVMTATPIPRTLALTVFGDLDVSVLSGSPPGRGTVQTEVVTPAGLGRVLDHMRDRLQGGEQAFVVCPRLGRADEIDGESSVGPDSGAHAAVRTHARLASGVWRGLRVGLLHGGMPAAEKEDVVVRFAARELDALVATTVVEVGVDVPSASLLLVENAERFGLSQLHQIRGRIARSGQDGACYLVARSRQDKATERLAILARTRDGFEIAEADLRLRGPGEVFGTRQHGLPELRFCDLIRDATLLDQARKDAAELLAVDGDLTRPEHRGLLAAMAGFFGATLSLIDAA